MRWTGATNRIADSVATIDETRLAKPSSSNGKFVRIYNTLSIKRNELITVNVPEEWKGKSIAVFTSSGKPISSQIVADSASAMPQLLYKANVPSMGYTTYQLKLHKPAPAK